MRLTRSRDGGTFHRPDCRYARRNREWRWAADRTVDEVRAAAEQAGAHACDICRPLDDVSEAT